MSTISDLHQLTIDFDGSAEQLAAVVELAKKVLAENGEPADRKTEKLDRNASNDRFVVFGIEDGIGGGDIERIRTRCRFMLDYFGFGEELVKTEADRGTGDFEVKSYFYDGTPHSFYFETSSEARSEARKWLTDSTDKIEVIHRPTGQVIGEYRPAINI